MGTHRSNCWAYTIHYTEQMYIPKHISVTQEMHNLLEVIREKP